MTLAFLKYYFPTMQNDIFAINGNRTAVMVIIFSLSVVYRLDMVARRELNE